MFFSTVTLLINFDTSTTVMLVLHWLPVYRCSGSAAKTAAETLISSS